MVADEVAQDGENVVISGFLKGNCINSNQIAHLTGFDDYQIEKIEILAMGSRQKIAANSEQLVQFQTVPEDINPFSKAETHNDEDILSAIQGLQLAPEEEPVKEIDE